MENGSRAHPYNTISEGLKHAKEGDELEVEKGTYKENITIPKEVWVYGAGGDREDIVIEAKNDDKPAVEMKHGSELSDVTVKGGRHGIRVLEDGKAHIYDVHITKSNRDGIHIDSADVSKKKRVLINKVEVEKAIVLVFIPKNDLLPSSTQIFMTMRVMALILLQEHMLGLKKMISETTVEVEQNWYSMD